MFIDFINEKVTIELEQGEDISRISESIKHTRDEVGRYLFEPYYFRNLNVMLAGYKIEKSSEISRVAPLLKVAVYVRVGTITTSLVPGTTPLPKEEILKATRFFNKGAKNVKSYQEGRWDGYTNLYDERRKVFPTGLLDIVLEVLDEKQIKYYVINEKYEQNLNPQKWVVDDGITPDEDQVEAVNTALMKSCGIIKAPTAFGKTAVLSKRIVAEFGVPAIFIANKKALLDDAAKEFETIFKEDGTPIKCLPIKDAKFGEFAMGSVDDYTKALESADVIVATIQSISARLDDEKTSATLRHWLKDKCGLMIVDEAQALGTPIWDKFARACFASNRIGISATPKRTDGATLKLIATTGPIIFSTSAERQIEKGRLCELEIFYKTHDHKIYNESDEAAEYNPMYEEFIINNETRNAEIVKYAKEFVEEGRHVLILVVRIDHGEILKDMLLGSGFKESDLRFIWGKTADKARTAAITEFRQGDFKIMIGSTIFDAGVNIPIISGVILAGAGNSDITLVQRIGRGARNYKYQGEIPEFIKKRDDGKKVTKIIDFLDKNIKFFHRQSRNRYNQAISEFGKDRVFFVGDDGVSRKAREKRSPEYLYQQKTAAEKARAAALSQFGEKTMSEVIDILNKVKN